MEWLSGAIISLIFTGVILWLHWGDQEKIHKKEIEQLKKEKQAALKETDNLRLKLLQLAKGEKNVVE